MKDFEEFWMKITGRTSPVDLDYRRYHNPSTLIKRPSDFIVATRVDIGPGNRGTIDTGGTGDTGSQ